MSPFYKGKLTPLYYHIYYLYGRQYINVVSVLNWCWVIYNEECLSLNHMMNADAILSVMLLIVKRIHFYFEP